MNQICSAIFGGVGNPVNFVLQCCEFIIKPASSVSIRVCRSSLGGEFLQTVYDVFDLVHGAFSHLNHGNGLLSILSGLHITFDVYPQFTGNSQTGGIICRLVDSVAGRKSFQRFAQIRI